MNFEELCGLQFNEKELSNKFLVYYKRWGVDHPENPRIAESNRAAIVKHEQWFYSKERRHLIISMPEKQVVNLLRFRLGSTDLLINDHRISRKDRLCQLCGSKSMEDELHVIYECRYYDNLRKQVAWNELFTVSTHPFCLKTFMNQDDQYKVAHFITALLKYRLEGMTNHRGLDFFSSSESSVYDSECEEGVI